MGQDGAMNETSWQRLYRLIEARREQLGITRSGLNALGAPSSEWVRKLQNEEGRPRMKQAGALRSLDGALGWPSGTAWGLVNDDRSTWAPGLLEDEEHQLVYGDALRGVEQEIRDFQTIVAARLRMLPEVEAHATMRKILGDLGIS